VAAGGGGYYFYTRRSARPPAPSYVDLKSQFQIPPALAIASATPASSAPTSRQQLPVQVPSLTSDGKQLPLKERLCAEQRLKYQARYNDVLDGLTAASATLATVAGVPASVQNNLKLLAKATPDRVENLIR